MKETLNRNQFINRFLEIRKDNFSDAALEAIFDYFEQVEEDTGEEAEFDPIAICCDFSEHEDFSEWKKDCYNSDLKDIDDLKDNTTVIEFKGGIIVKRF